MVVVADRTDGSWGLLRVNPCKQRLYMEALEKHHPRVVAYYPVYEKVVRPSGCRRVKRVVVAVWPGYVFVRVDDFECLVDPVSLPVRGRWVRFGGRIQLVQGVVVERLKRLEFSGELVREVVREVVHVSPYVVGKKVRVNLPGVSMGGSMGDIRGIIVRGMGGNRAEVETNLCRVLVSVHNLEIL